jgi:glycerol uptake facilitator-like aquaporin
VPFVAQFVAATGDLSWAPAIALGVTLPALLLPNGHLRSRRWWLVVIASLTGSVLITWPPPVPGTT